MKIFKSIAFITILSLVAFAFTYAITDIKPAVGDKAPEIALPNIDGNTLKLSDLRGKVVLIDFWASWCRTCRVENINFKKAYSKFKDMNFDVGNGFEIYSVSLDKDSEVWKKAIANDRMNWKYHVSDLKKWDSPIVETYNFKYLPHNLLIDQEGTIIAKGLFGNNLDKFLTSHLAE
ncbi:MAG: TlpA family protein disulfide reductase [Bacteroidia bacterium]|nr:TlpA family protein disulfide reductase [Bacteroidia bacterium]